MSDGPAPDGAPLDEDPLGEPGALGDGGPPFEELSLPLTLGAELGDDGTLFGTLEVDGTSVEVGTLELDAVVTSSTLDMALTWPEPLIDVTVTA